MQARVLAEDQAQREKAHVELLEERMRHMVTKEAADAAVCEARDLEAAMAKLGETMRDMVPKARHEAVATELEILRKSVSDMVPTRDYERVREELASRSHEHQVLLRQMEGMVGRGHLEAGERRLRQAGHGLEGCTEQIRQACVEAAQLGMAMTGMVDEPAYLHALSEIGQLQAELERLSWIESECVERMVPRHRYEVLEAQMLARASEHAALLQRLREAEAALSVVDVQRCHDEVQWAP